MARHPTFASLSRQRRRAPPAALDLSRSAYSPILVSQEKLSAAQIVDIPPAVFDCLNQFEEEQARASAELEHTQAAFTAALEDDPLPGVRARSPTAYRSAGRAIPMDVGGDFDRPDTPPKVFGGECEKVGGLLPDGGYRFPLLDAAYEFPQPCAPVTRPSIDTIELRKKKSSCISVPWSAMMQILRLRGRRRQNHGRVLPEPLGFHERIKNSGHEWRPSRF